MAQSQELKILSLDGGGIKGLSSLIILKTIMDRVGAKMMPPQIDLKPCDYFDLIGGTSTGGIIAIMLGRLRMSVDDCIREYITLGREVFAEPRSLPNENMFDAAKLENAIKKVLKSTIGDGKEDEPLKDPLGAECCKAVVFTLPFTAPASSQPTAFRSYSCAHAPKIEPYTIWQAARATSAAPTFFKPLVTGKPPHDRRWVDAGLGFNNPARVVLEEAGRLWGDDYGQLDPNKHISVFLSLGTGFKAVVRFEAETRKEKISAKFRMPIKAVEVMEEIATRTETVHTSIRTLFQPKLDIYHRFNVEQGLQNFELYDYQQIEAIRADTENYIMARDREVIECVIGMSRLPLQLKPLEARGNSAEYFGSTGDSDDVSLLKRLADLRISSDQFNHNAKSLEASDTYKTSISRIKSNATYMWNAVVLVDILDKQGRLLAEDLVLEEKLRPQGTGYSNSSPTGYDESMVRASRQIYACERLHQALVIYRHLFYATELQFNSLSLDHCWVANRLGKILEIFGLRQEAFDLYVRARDGRMRHLPSHKASKESQERAQALRLALGRQ
ncbi:acyl transferase/acyl hydrolase/lysophospholipase [Halenospora varia]|nr:acyl transferase/acyl hydrolase/lysophospholipase [Halenospora varia]